MSSEQRRYPRLRLNLRVRVHGMYMLTNNISMSGAQVSCPAMKYQVISKKLAGGDAPVDLVLGQARVPVTGEILYASDYGDEFLLGVAFKSFDDAALVTFRDFLIAAGGPQAVELETVADE